MDPLNEPTPSAEELRAAKMQEIRSLKSTAAALRDRSKLSLEEARGCEKHARELQETLSQP